jgi:hypothetical protein
MRAVYEDPYFRAELLTGEKILRVVRSAEPFPSVATAEAIFLAMSGALRELPISTMALLLDVREGPGRNDAAFENMVSEKRGLVFGGFARAAILLATMTGVLQSKRLERESGGRIHVEPFTDEAKALAYLRG